MHKSSLKSGIVGLAALLSFAAVHADDAAMIEQARGVASAIPPKLLNMLTDEIAKGGMDGAIAVCREKAPQMAKAASEKSGWNVRRVSLKNRNPKAVPDAWERSVLEDFDARAKAGEPAAKLERGEVVSVGNEKFYRYMKALPTNDLCMNCHGPAEGIAPAVSQRLHELYPDDKAVGYAPGEIRGAITLKRPL